MADRDATLLARLVAATALVGVLLLGAAAQAAPWNVQATLELQLTGFPAVTATGSGSVDLTGGVLSVPASLVTLSSATIPVTSTTAIDSLVASGIANQAGTFQVGGATTQAPGEVCGAPLSGEACVAGGGLGGLMGLSGALNVVVIPSLVIFPFDLDAARVGRGGSAGTTVGYIADGAPWTTGTARVGVYTASGAPGALSTAGGSGPGSLTLVTTTFISACGNTLPLVGRFTLTSVPEPAMLALVVLGAAGLWSLRRWGG
jgi:hypothetical protein